MICRGDRCLNCFNQYERRALRLCLRECSVFLFRREKAKKDESPRSAPVKASLCAGRPAPYPFTLPRAMPVTKYFCRKGYTTRMGTVEMTVMAQRMVTGVVRVLDFRASVVVLAALALA